MMTITSLGFEGPNLEGEIYEFTIHIEYDSGTTNADLKKLVDEVCNCDSREIYAIKWEGDVNDDSNEMLLYIQTEKRYSRKSLIEFWTHQFLEVFDVEVKDDEISMDDFFDDKWDMLMIKVDSKYI